MKYTRLQYFFWLISGSEISVLEKCENDYNRHANIGLMILITSVFAAFTSFIAGYTFAPDNLPAVLTFSLVWASLIFAIDRSMVNSIKRDPGAGAIAVPFWSYFVPRLILAFILAFFMSIPLDHLIFHEKIRKQMIDNNEAAAAAHQASLTGRYNTMGTERVLEGLKKEDTALILERRAGCPLPEYREAKSSSVALDPQIGTAKTDVTNKEERANNYYSTLPYADSIRRRRVPDVTMTSLWQQRNEARIRLADLVARKTSFDAAATAVYDKWEKQELDKRNRADSLIAKTNGKLVADRDSVTNKATAYSRELEDMKGFDTQFTTLFLMPNWGVQVLKWLIFLALLVIEILPTYLKLKTPIGQYDKRIQENETLAENDITHNIASENAIRQQSEAHRVTAGVGLNTAIYDRIAAIELQLAEEILAEWEQQQRNNNGLIARP